MYIYNLFLLFIYNLTFFISLYTILKLAIILSYYTMKNASKLIARIS